MSIPCTNELVRQYERMVYFWAHRLRKGGCICSFDDLVSAGFLGIVRAAETFDTHVASFTTHVYNSIAGWMRNEIRATGRLWREHDRGSVVESAVAGNTPWLETEKAEFWKTIEKAVLPVDAAILRMYYLDHLTQAEIAAKVGVTQSMISLRHRRALRVLRDHPKMEVYTNG